MDVCQGDGSIRYPVENRPENHLRPGESSRQYLYCSFQYNLDRNLLHSPRFEDACRHYLTHLSKAVISEYAECFSSARAERISVLPISSECQTSCGILIRLWSVCGRILVHQCAIIRYKYFYRHYRHLIWLFTFSRSSTSHRWPVSRRILAVSDHLHRRNRSRVLATYCWNRCI